MTMNEYDIEDAADLLAARRPEIARYATFLKDWCGTVNANSDGWAYYASASGAARRLQGLVKTAVEITRGFKPASDMPSEAMFKSSLTPIRQFATKKGWQAPTLGDEPDAPAPGLR